LAEAGKAASEEHGDALADGTPVEGLAAADLVEGEDADEGAEHVEDCVEAGDPLGFVGVETGDAEDGGCVFVRNQ
jgi:hypothetical protein